MGARGSKIGRFKSFWTVEMALMADLSHHDEAGIRSAAYGKEGVNGSSPLEGFAVFGLAERNCRAVEQVNNLVGAHTGGTAFSSWAPRLVPVFKTGGFRLYERDRRERGASCGASAAFSASGRCAITRPRVAVERAAYRSWGNEHVVRDLLKAHVERTAAHMQLAHS